MTMDLNLVRGVITALSLVCFIGIVVWAYRPTRKQRFEEAANLPFADDERSGHA